MKASKDSSISTHAFQFVSRGGEKLSAALDAFGIGVAGLVCADLGSHVGGFVDCLLQRGAAKVYSVDTSYGTLAWKLRKDPRIVVLERTNALHVQLPQTVDLVTIDVGWTPQGRILPHAVTLVKPGGRLVALVKPQYEADAAELVKGTLEDEIGERVFQHVASQVSAYGLIVQGTMASPIRGHGGNREFFLHMVAST